MYKKYTIKYGMANRLYHKIFLIMRLTIAILIASLIQVSAASFGQRITINRQNVEIKSLFKEIRKQSGFDFYYDGKLIGSDQKASVKAKNASIEQVLDQLLRGTNLTYLIEGKIVSITRADNSVNIKISPPQTINVRGVVKNELGILQEGITVAVKGSGQATRTNEKGEYGLNNVAEDATLVFSGLTIETLEIKLKGKQVFNVSVKTKQVQLAEVKVINTGYQKLSPNQVAGSYQVITNEELNRRAGPDLMSRLEGVTTGMLFDRRNQSPDQRGINTNNINIRGISTITESIKTPLIILNNFPYEGDINNINPNDVESVTILKDAAAASIWGARAGNGVIVITTKQGQFNRPVQVTFTSNINIIQKPDLFHNPSISVSDFIDMEKFLFDKGFYDADLENTYSKPAVTPVVEILEKQRLGQLSAQQANAQIDAFRREDIRRDFAKYIYRQSVNQQHSLNLSGGSEQLKYSFSTGYDQNPSILTGNQNDRISIRSDNTFVPVKNLEFNLGINYTKVSAQNNSLGNMGDPHYSYLPGGPKSLYPYARFADDNGLPLVIPRDYRTAYTDTAGGGKLMDWKYRPLEELNANDRTSKGQDLLLSFNTSYKFRPWLMLQLSYQYQNAINKSLEYYNEQTYYTRSLVNLFSRIENGTVKYNLPKGGILGELNNDMSSNKGRLQLNFNPVLGTDHTITGFLGAEISEKINEINTEKKFGYDKDMMSSIPIDQVSLFPMFTGTGFARISTAQTAFKLVNRFVSTYFNAAYTYQNRYTLSASARSDAANLLGVSINNKWKPLWSAGLSWNLSNEPFYQFAALPELRFRFTYGYQGNVNSSLSPEAIIYKDPAESNLINEPFASLSQTGDPDLRWETVRQINFGLDFGLAKGVLNGRVDVYYKRSSDLIFFAPVDFTTGIDGVKRNSASISGSGVEIALNSHNINRAFKWQTNLLFSYNTNKVTEYLRDDKGLPLSVIFQRDGLSLYPLKGFDPYGLYSYTFAGLDPQTGDPQGMLNNKVSKDYRAILEQTIDNYSDLIYHGTTLPPYFGNLNNTFSYKGISLLVNLSYRFGFYFRKNSINYYSQIFFAGGMHRDFAKRWQQPGDEKFTNIPSLVYPLNNGDRDAFYTSSSATVFRGDHIRLQSIRLSYTLNKDKVIKLPFKSLEMYAIADNIGLLWRANKAGLDPEYDRGDALFPLQRNVAIGLKVGL